MHPLAVSEPGPVQTSRGRRALSPAVRWLVGLESMMSLSGLSGGVFMATHPRTMMPLKYLNGTFFDTWRWPGVALAIFVGVCPAIVVAATLVRSRFAILGHQCVGAGLVAWVVLEAAWVVVSAPLQIAVGVVGAVIFVLGRREASPARDGPRA